MEPDVALFQRRLGETRKARRMTFGEVAKASGLSKPYIWELERGSVKNPTIRAVWAIAGALGVTPSYLIGLDENKSELDPLAHQIATIINVELARRATARGDAS